MIYLGQSLRRFEDHHLLTGQSQFVDDMMLPDMLHAVVLRSPHAHAAITSMEVAAARQATGVVSVVTALDLEHVAAHIPTRRNADADELSPPEHPVLASDKVCYVGQPIAIVVAESLSAARDALELIEVDYAPLPVVVDPLLATHPDTPVVHAELGTNRVLQVTSAGGDLAAAFAQADHVVRQQYQVQRLAPAPMETRGLVADYQAQDDRLTVWDSTQNPHGMKPRLAQLLGRPERSIRVVTPDVGGGFGEKGCLFPEEVAIAYLATRLERPVKWVETRQENQLAFHGRGHIVEVEAAAQSDGTLLGLRVHIVADLGAYFLLSTPTVPVSTSHRLTGPYTTPAMCIEVHGVVTNKPPTGAYRGAGGPEAAFCMERTIDLIAQELNLDPAEVRRKNLIPPDAFPYTTPTGIMYDSGQYEQALDRALELSDYATWRSRSRQQVLTQEPLIGVGLATVVKGTGARTPNLAEHARVIIEPSGRVLLHLGISPHGQGSETTFAQIVADELGVRPADVQVLHGDTDDLPGGGGTSGSRGLIAGSSAAHVVLQEARQRLILIATHLLDCRPEDVVFQDGEVYDRHHPERSVPFSRIAAMAHDEAQLPPGVERGLDFSGSHTLPASPYAFAAHVAVVEVSPETGAIRLLNYVAVHDAGRIVNPLLAAGQVQGSIVQGIGQALLEGMIYSPEGQPLTGTLSDYAVPRAIHIPELTLDTLETLSPLTPLGVKGIGELPTLAAPAAVANAVMDALSHWGIRHIDTPLTPAKIWQALQEAGERATTSG
ncbi:xanthine dehydrogenase family protein molybdopterin-binding subunit [Candidatus Entotheonella palauensis]|uniref:xanthine dehydrogenase family protein molybdopterin-binding subunit n=1 Tax=Candidatus Entotheonella palauensis TaxID=93172 RepID=UPI000B7DAC8F|nr:xanthine dehydrogenase family protein molybdopterin-binding subunit [Candidatus Entotheonella palauensis]